VTGRACKKGDAQRLSVATVGLQARTQTGSSGTRGTRTDCYFALPCNYTATSNLYARTLRTEEDVHRTLFGAEGLADVTRCSARLSTCKNDTNNKLHQK
jgi:hypothetical protein